MTNISLGEVTELRDFLTTAHNHLRAIERAGEPEGASGNDGSGQFVYSIKEPSAEGRGTSAVETSLVQGAASSAEGHREGEDSMNSNNMDLF